MTPSRPHCLRRVWPGLAAERAAWTGPVRLTFDDGPHPVHTPATLDRLARFGASATFYAVGRSVAESPDVLREVVAAGHAVGNHTFSHRAPRPWDGVAAARDIEMAQNAIRDATGVTPTHFRPPLGRLTPASWIAARRLGLRVALWALDSNDWRCRSLADAHICGRAVAAAARPGDVILLHDAGPFIGAILDELLPRLRGAGLMGPG